MIRYLIVALVVVVVPGPDFALTLRNSISRARGLATALAPHAMARRGTAERTGRSDGAVDEMRHGRRVDDVDHAQPAVHSVEEPHTVAEEHRRDVQA